MTAVRCPDENEVCTSYKKYVERNGFNLELIDGNQTFVDFILEKVRLQRKYPNSINFFDFF